MADPIMVVNAIVTNLSAASALGSRGVSKDYSIIEQSQGPCAVVSWIESSSVPAHFGGTRERQWTYLVELFVKDTGSASAVMDHHSTSLLTVLESLESDQTLQGTVSQVNEIRASRKPGEAIMTETVALFPINIEIDTLEWL